MGIHLQRVFIPRASGAGFALAACLLAAVLSGCAVRQPESPAKQAEMLAEAHVEQGRALAAQGRYAEALAELDLAVRTAPQQAAVRAEALRERAWTQLKRGDAPHAEADFTALLETAPEDLWAHAGRGLARSLAGRHEGAAQDFGFVLEREPENLTALLNRGFSRASLGQHALAVEDFSRVVGLTDAQDTQVSSSAVDPLALYYRARSLAALGRNVQAALDYDRLFALTPDHGAAAARELLGPEPGALELLLAQAKSDTDGGKTLEILDCVARLLLEKDTTACRSSVF